jgi:hypothetical protein
LVPILAASFALLLSAASAEAFVYWTDPSDYSIGRASVDGGGVDDSFVPLALGACGLATDSQYLYWGDSRLNQVDRVTLDGEPATAIFGGGDGTCGVSQSNGLIAWANFGNSTIGLGEPSTGFVRQDWVAGPPASQTVLGTASFYDGVNDLIYWVNEDGSIWRTFGDAQAPSQILPPLTVPGEAGIAASPAGIYWMDAAHGRIGSAGLDGSNPQIIISGLSGSPCGVALDDTYVYWANQDAGSIGRAFLDGSSPDQSFIQVPSAAPCWIAVNEDTASAAISPSSLGFGSVVVGGGPSASQDVTLTNSTSTSVDLLPGAATLGGPDANQFSIASDACFGQTVAPGGSCTISVDFSPTSLGGKAATLTIPSNDPDSPNTVALSGAGTDPDQTVSPSSIPFGTASVGTQSPTQVVTLSNGAGASAPDIVGQASLAGAGAGQFELVSDGCSNTTVAIGASCEISVAFAPNTVGQAAASVRIPSDDPTSPATVALSGTGTAPDEVVQPGSLGFGQQQVGTQSATQVVTVGNSADATGALEVDGISLTGGGAAQFALVFDGCSGQSVQPGDSCTLGVRFAPSSAGASDASLQIPSNDPAGDPAVSLSGTGMAAPSATPGQNPRCKSLRAKLRKAKSKKAKKRIRKQLKKRGC